MPYDFTKLSDVNINQTIEDSTYSLVVNGNEVQKASSLNMTNTIKNYYTEYTEYLVDHSQATPIDFILSLSPIFVDETTCKERIGYLLIDNQDPDEPDFYYYFKVYGEVGSTFYNIQETNFKNNVIMNYIYGPSDLISSYQVNEFAKYFYIEASGTGDNRININKSWSDIQDAIINGNVLVLKYKTNVETNSYDICFLNDIKVTYDSSVNPAVPANIEFLDYIYSGTGEVYKVIYFYMDSGQVIITVNNFDKINTTDGVAKNSLQIESNALAIKPTLKFKKDTKNILIDFDNTNSSEAIEISGTVDSSLTGFYPKLKGIGSPVDDNDVTNKQYVDNIQSTLSGNINNKMDKANPSGTGNLTLNISPNDGNVYTRVFNITKNNRTLQIDLNNYSSSDKYSVKLNTSDSKDIFIDGLHVQSPDSDDDYAIANKKYVDDCFNEFDHNVDYTIYDSLTLEDTSSEDSNVEPYFILKKNNVGEQTNPSEISFNIDYNDATRLRLKGKAYSSGSSITFNPILEGLGDPIGINDAANKQYVDNQSATISFNNITSYTVDLNQYRRKRCYLASTTKSLGFSDFSSSACEECFVFFRTYNSDDFSVNFSNTIYVPTLEDGTAFTFIKNTYYSIHFTRGPTANGYRTFADIKRYRTADII